jgi:hypothetical protein
MTATQTTASPRFIVQHGTAGIRRVVSVETGKSVDGIDYTDFESAKAVRDRLNGVTSTVAEATAPSLPKPQDHLRKGERRPAKTGRAARVRIGTHWQRAMIAVRNSGRILARDFLAGLGLDAAWIDQYESAFGRATAKAYRQNHGAEPDTRGLVWLRGRLWHANRYADINDLRAGIAAYPRLAALIGV